VFLHDEPGLCASGLLGNVTKRDNVIAIETYIIIPSYSTGGFTGNLMLHIDNPLSPEIMTIG
tara:strand:+ start:1088 stop:1273 length:186 start_codon:yes stop_codon:yes gene_type:complete